METDLIKNSDITPSTSQIPDWSITDYVIDVETSDRPHAGTTCNVFVQLFGEGGISEPIKLDIGQSCVNNPAFQRGQLDQYIIFKTTCYGKLESIKIWHDGSGAKPSWHFAQVTVNDTKLGVAFRFACHRWLAENLDDGKICREVRCIEMVAGPKQTLQTAAGVPKPLTTDDEDSESTE